MTSGPICDSRVVAGADDDRRHPLGDGGDQRSATRADGDDHRDGHAALARRAVAGGDGRVGRGGDVGVGQHDHVVLGPAERLARACRGAPPSRRRAGRSGVLPTKETAATSGSVEQRVDRDGVTVDDVEHAVGHAGLAGQLGEEERGRRVPLGGLEHEGVAAGDGVGQHPERDHHREVERRDAGDDAQRLEHGVDVHAGGHLGRVRALEQVRDAAGELDVLEPARHLAGGVAQHLAVLGRDGGGQVGRGPADQVAQAKEDGGAGAERAGAPFGGGLGRRGDRVATSSAAARAPCRLDARGPGRRPARTARRSRDRLAPDPCSSSRMDTILPRAAAAAGLSRRAGTGAGSSCTSLASSSVTMRSCSSQVAPGRARAPAAPHEEDQHREDRLPDRGTPSTSASTRPATVFCAGTSFCSATRRLARFGEYLATPAIWAWLTGLPF